MTFFLPPLFLTMTASTTEPKFSIGDDGRVPGGPFNKVWVDERSGSDWYLSISNDVN